MNKQFYCLIIIIKLKINHSFNGNIHLQNMAQELTS